MEKLFTINKIDFYREEFLDDINEFKDIIDIIQDFQESLKIEKLIA